jgi:hypothetical protein
MSIVAYDGSFTMIGSPLMVMPFSKAAWRAPATGARAHAEF